MLRKERGANLVEIALVSTLLILMLAAIVDLGGAFSQYLIISNAAREGARVASRLPCKASNATAYKQAIIDAAIQEAGAGGLTLASEDISVIPDPETTCPSAGATLAVVVVYNYPTILGNAIGSATIQLTNDASMVFFGNDQNLPGEYPTSP